MLKFVILNGYQSKEAGHGTRTYDTTLAEDKAAAEAEFERLLAEGRTALTADGTPVTQAADMPQEGEVNFLLPMMGG